MRQFLALLCLAGCNALYGLDPTELSQAPDTDGDGVADADDNCPLVANPTQNDEDHDTFGDFCDDCPLVFDPEQHDLGDGDGIGDRCDPHPTTAGDCLRLFDSFDTDPSTYWRIAGDPGGSVQADVGFARLLPGSGDTFLLAPDLAGNFDVQIAGYVKLGKALAVSNVTTTATGVGCGARKGLASNEVVIARFPQPDEPFTFGPQVGTSLLFALTSRSETMETTCRVELGAIRRFEALPPLDYPTGNPGALVSINPLELHGIAIYEQRATCPPAVFR